MFVGHIGAAFAGKRLSPSTSLVWFVAAANFVDLLWPIFLLLGIETVRVAPGDTAFTGLAFESYPWSHSLLMVVVWGVALGALARWRGVDKRGSMIVGALVVSHWVLDFVTHRPDLPLWPGQETGYGLGLWNSMVGTYAVEIVLWAVGIALFLRVRRGGVAFWSFVVVSTLMWATSPFAPPPPDASAIAWFGIFGWIIILWAWWIERTSEAR